MPIIPVPDDLRTWVEIDHSALRQNLAFVRRRIGTEASILAVVKANAYGHGAEEIVRTLSGDTAVFGVANLGEAEKVAAAGTGRDVLLMSPCLPAERKAAVKAGHIVTVSSAEEAEAFARFGGVRVNFKIDTGMGRIGCRKDRAVEEVSRLIAAPGVDLHSLSTHLPSADVDSGFTATQLREFRQLLGELRAVVGKVACHALNSAGLLTKPEHDFDFVRPGLILYGVSPLPEYQRELVPVLAWKARAVLVRDLPEGAGVSYGRSFVTTQATRAAVLAVGYADGFPRQASGQGAGVLLRGVWCPLLGRVTMDQIVVDVSGVPGIREGDVATLIGRDGDREIPAQELAEQADTIPWDILARIGERVERIHARASGLGEEPDR
jgi:alanine racemase